MDDTEFFQEPRTIKELAAHFRFTRRYITTEIAEGRLRALKFSHSLVRLRPKDILDWMNEKATAPEREDIK
jgi:hypothetical protein